MSALSLATWGVICKDRALSMSSWGVFCGDVVFGGNQFLVFKPILDAIKGQIQIDQNLVSYEKLSEVKVEIDGKEYEIVEPKTPGEIIKSIADVERVIREAAEDERIPPSRAKRELYTRILDEIKKVEEIKRTVFNDDEEVVMILVASDVI